MQIFDEMKKIVSDTLDSRVEEIRKSFVNEVESIKPKKVNITINDSTFEAAPGEMFHNKFKEVLQCVKLNIPLFLTGDAGSGKTTLAEQCAAAIKLPFYCISVCLQTSETAFLGYKNANGAYVRTLFREAYEHGGVFLIDEIDNGNPNVLSVLNSALANHVCAFPDGMVTKHNDFRLIASGNTIGRGADRKYVGRLEMDLATLDRFAVIQIDYDEEIERQCSHSSIATRVQQIRKMVHDKNIRLIVSPRASINISKLISAGVKFKHAVELCILKGCDQSIKEQLKHYILDAPAGIK